MPRTQDANHCFVCGPGNPIGLGVRFRLVDDLCLGEFTPDERHSGFRAVTHGGIVFSLLDDVMANWLWLRDLAAFTAKADVRYRAELPVGTAVYLEGRCLARKGQAGADAGQGHPAGQRRTRGGGHGQLHGVRGQALTWVQGKPRGGKATQIRPASP